MKIGIQFSQPRLEADASLSISKYIDWIELAHRAGFKSFWMGQHFMLSKYILFQPFTIMARASATTKGMMMGTAVLLLPLLNPVDVAEQGANIDELTGGGFILGVGQGYRDSEFAGSGIRKEEAASRFEEAVEVIRRLWEGDGSRFTGRHFTLDDDFINPRPLQRPRPPILVGAYAEKAVRRAGRIGDGWIIPPELGEREIDGHLTIFRVEMKKRGAQGRLVLMRAFHLTDDQREAEKVRSRIREHFERKKSWGLVNKEKSAPESDDISIVGDTDYCQEKIDHFRKKYGPEQMVLLQGFHGTAEREMVRSIKLTGETIIPHFG